MLFKKITKLSVLLAITLASIFTYQPALADAAEDLAITAEVKAKLISEKDIPNNISVSTSDRVVVLKGMVDTDLQAHHAIEIASSVDKVVDVADSQLKVKESKSLLKDTIITAKVKGKIRHLFSTRKIAHGYELHVETTDQVVHILGKVARQADIDTVVAAAKEVKDVKSVKTNISY
jgi:osmotically-inducible protein OsmY